MVSGYPETATGQPRDSPLDRWPGVRSIHLSSHQRNRGKNRGQSGWIMAETNSNRGPLQTRSDYSGTREFIGGYSSQ
jgi:hypothetical protein